MAGSCPGLLPCPLPWDGSGWPRPPGSAAASVRTRLALSVPQPGCDGFGVGAGRSPAKSPACAKGTRGGSGGTLLAAPSHRHGWVISKPSSACGDPGPSLRWDASPCTPDIANGFIAQNRRDLAPGCQAVSLLAERTPSEVGCEGALLTLLGRASLPSLPHIPRQRPPCQPRAGGSRAQALYPWRDHGTVQGSPPWQEGPLSPVRGSVQGWLPCQQCPQGQPRQLTSCPQPCQRLRHDWPGITGVAGELFALSLPAGTSCGSCLVGAANEGHRQLEGEVD